MGLRHPLGRRRRRLLSCQQLLDLAQFLEYRIALILGHRRGQSRPADGEDDRTDYCHQVILHDFP